MAKSNAALIKSRLSAAHEDYLKAIYILGAQGAPVTNSALAEFLGVSPASATNMVKKLDELGLVEYEKYREILLNDSGRRVALEVLRHHRLLELYLHEQLNLTWDQVHDEAERLEHVMSDVLEDAITAALGDPTHDPHGDPIPTKDGRIAPVEGMPLSQAEPRQAYRLVRVLVQDAKRLTYLGSMGLYPNATVILSKRSPFDGPLLIEVNDEPQALDYRLARQILVAPAA
ncbi:MAG: metal-dependent transcriptional regulator [Caldilineaceae bacterium]|nr:metal-dependent transcriptional regulator [Caldilineaceae bacterium]